jgi:polyhydroxyalkanoate synthesis regulator phasin
MPGDELFKRYLEIGASVLGMSRERAETIVRDLVASGEVAKGQASKAADWLVERGRSGTEELAELVRREIRQQIAALGLATKEDVAALQARLDDLAPAPAPAAQAPPPPVKAPRAPRKANPKGGTPAKAAGPTATKSAGISRSGSVRKRSGASSSVEPGAAPPAGGADPSKG